MACWRLHPCFRKNIFSQTHPARFQNAQCKHWNDCIFSVVFDGLYLVATRPAMDGHPSPAPIYGNGPSYRAGTCLVGQYFGGLSRLCTWHTPSHPIGHLCLPDCLSDFFSAATMADHLFSESCNGTYWVFQVDLFSVIRFCVPYLDWPNRCSCLHSTKVCLCSQKSKGRLNDQM